MLSFQLKHLHIVGFILTFLIFIQLISALVFRANIKDAIESDFISFYTGIKIVSLGEGNNLYDLNTQFKYQQDIIKDYVDTDFLLPYRNLPFVAIFLLPLARPSLVLSYVLYVLALIILLVFITFKSASIFPEIKKIFYWSFLPLLFLPNLRSIQLAQFSPIVLIIYLLLYKYMSQKKSFTAGLTTGLLLIKPQYLLVFPFMLLLVDSKKKYVSGFLLLSGLLVLISLFAVGPYSLYKYPAFLLETESASFGSRPWQMFTFYSLFRQAPLLNSLNLYWILIINLCFYFTSFVIYVRHSGKLPFDINFSNALILTVMFSIHALAHDVSLLFIPFLIFIKLFGRMKSRRSRVLLSLSILVIWLVPFVKYTNLTYLSSLIFLLIIFTSTKAVLPRNK